MAREQKTASLKRQSIFNVPNCLTMLRVVMIPAVLLLLVENDPKSWFWSANLYMLSCITDGLDGWLARRQGVTSVFGQFLDPLADKLLVMSTLVFLVDMDRVPAWLCALILGRELTITALRTIAMNEGIVIAAGRGGKDKTVFQMVAIFMLILHDTYHVDFGFFSVQANLHEVGLLVLFISLFFALGSAAQYMWRFSKQIAQRG